MDCSILPLSFSHITFDCHINIECAASLGSFKYLFKYIQKGPDLASLEINERDEIKRYTEGRYIASCEAGHRIYQFDVHDQIPNVVRLQIHLPGQHMIAFDPEEDISSILSRASHERTTLTAYFEANTDSTELGTEARKYTYQEFPQHFVWKPDAKKWAMRQRDFAIGRMYFIPPTAGEQFYLRTLLTVVRGAKSFEDLRRYKSDKAHPTFHAACIARGLLEDDGEWNQCLEEASEMQTGTCLRYLFTTILLFCTPSQPDQLWKKFRHHICDDLAYRLHAMGLANATNDEICDYGLNEKRAGSPTHLFGRRRWFSGGFPLPPCLSCAEFFRSRIPHLPSLSVPPSQQGRTCHDAIFLLLWVPHMFGPFYIRKGVTS